MSATSPIPTLGPSEGAIYLQPSTVEVINLIEVVKDDVLATARIGTIQAVKHI